MLQFVNFVIAVPWRMLLYCSGVAAVFIGGCQFGEGRVNREWNTAKEATAQAVAKQASRVAAAAARQINISQEISNEFQENKAAIAADRQRLLARVPRRLRFAPPSGDGAVPGISPTAAIAATEPADHVPAAAASAGSETCQRLAEDAALTTLMVTEFQKWYREQSDLHHAIPP